MNLTLLRGFARDHLSFAFMYFISHLLIGLYCNFYVTSGIQLIYMMSIYLYVFVIFIGFRLFRYVSTHREMEKLAENVEIEEKGFSYEQTTAIRMMQRIHRTYQDQIYEIKTQTGHNHKLISQWIHNLKTPLSVIDLILQKQKMNGNEDSETLLHIEEEKDRLLHMLGQMLKFFRLEHFTRDYTPEPVNLTRALRGLINAGRNQYIYNNVYPQLESEEDAVVMTDSKWNTVMLEQIISNAIKYSASKTETKTLLFRTRRQGDQIVLTVKDEGIGIAQVDLQRVFQPFFTGKNGRTHNQATGIGLYVTSEIARKLGHGLSIRSEPGKGTEVEISYLSKMKDNVT